MGKPSPQPWKLEVPKPLDLADEMGDHDDPTLEFLITEPDDFMTELELDDQPTKQHKIPQGGQDGA